MMFKVCILAAVLACVFAYPGSGGMQLTEDQRAQLDILKAQLCATSDLNTRLAIHDQMHALVGKPSLAEITQQMVAGGMEPPSMEMMQQKFEYMCSTNL